MQKIFHLSEIQGYEPPLVWFRFTGHKFEGLPYFVAESCTELHVADIHVHKVILWKGRDKSCKFIIIYARCWKQNLKSKIKPTVVAIGAQGKPQGIRSALWNSKWKFPAQDRFRFLYFLGG